MVTQSKLDSLMESLTNILVGLAVSFVANLLILPPLLGVEITAETNLLIGCFYTIVSLIRSYAIRRAFNGRSVWEAIKSAFRRSKP